MTRTTAVAMGRIARLSNTVDSREPLATSGRVGDPSCVADGRLPGVWRLILIAICTLILCSCRGPASPHSSGMSGQGSPALPQQASTGAVTPAGYNQDQGPLGPPGWEMGIPLPYTPAGPWSPPGIAGPWPPDEYLADGGDHGVQVAVGAKGQIRGLEMEDTVAQFDTLDGRTIVEPSNEVELYSPRFRSVRQVVGVNESEQMIASSGVVQPERLVSTGDVGTPGSTKQNLHTVRQVGRKSITIARTRQGDGAISTAIGPAGFDNGFKPYENISVIRTGKFEAADRAWLARGTTAAITWVNNQAVQIMLDHKAASALVRDEKTDTLYSVDEPPAHPKLRIIKVASTPFAEVGDTVDFTLRFDNVGNQVIGNVVVMDSLTTRLEFVPGSAQSSLKAAFSTQPNEGGSAVLRWELAEPLPAGKGGVLRFTSRVR
jgi:uncharacterized repeat protein (TIGR01451 family)